MNIECNWCGQVVEHSATTKNGCCVECNKTLSKIESEENSSFTVQFYIHLPNNSAHKLSGFEGLFTGRKIEENIDAFRNKCDKSSSMSFQVYSDMQTPVTLILWGDILKNSWMEVCKRPA